MYLVMILEFNCRKLLNYFGLFPTLIAHAPPSIETETKTAQIMKLTKPLFILAPAILLLAGASIQTASASADGGAVTNAILAEDEDNDGLPDGWEIEYFGDIYFTDGDQDSDGDGYLDRDEFEWGSDPTVPYHYDEDGDGLDQITENEIGTNPDVADTDGDGVNDGDEVDNGTDPLDPNDY